MRSNQLVYSRIRIQTALLLSLSPGANKVIEEAASNEK